MSATRARSSLAAVLAVVLALGLAGVLRAVAAPVSSLPGLIELPPLRTLVGASNPDGSTVAVAWLREVGTDTQLWVMTRVDGDWKQPVLVSRAGTDAEHPDLEIDGDTPVVAWVEHSLSTSRVVVRSAAPSGAGPREVTARVNVPSGPRLGVGGGDRVVAWSSYDLDTGTKKAYASVDSGSGFGPVEQVTVPEGHAGFEVSDVAAGGGFHLTTTVQTYGSPGLTTAWSVRHDGEWRTAVLPLAWGDQHWSSYVETDPITGDALILNTHDTGVDDGLGPLQTVVRTYDADAPLLPGEGPDARLSEPDLLVAELAAQGVERVGNDVMAVTPLGYATLQTSGPAPTVSWHEQHCTRGAWMLVEGERWCRSTTSPVVQDVEMLRDGERVALVTPGASADAVHVDVISPVIPVLGLRETVEDGLTVVSTSLLDLTLTATPTVVATGLPTTSTPTATSSPTPSATSTPTATRPPARPPVTVLRLRSPRVKGKAVVGKRLRATAGRWSPSPTRVRYQWSVDGRTVGRKKKVKVKRSMVGSSLTVLVRVVTPAGRAAAVATSKVVKAKKARRR